MIIRTAKTEDLQKLLQFSKSIDIGMTSIPRDHSSWEKKLHINTSSLNSNPEKPNGEVYLLVMDSKDGTQIIGTSSIIAGVGLYQPFYSYKISKFVAMSKPLNMSVNMDVLLLVNDFTGYSELSSLFVMPDFRKSNVGLFLSKSRFLLLHDFPSRFGDLIFAELRGKQDETGRSAFWNALGSKFFKVPFYKADFQNAIDGTQFISDIMPKYPVYPALLPQEAQDVIGKPHPDAAPAMRLLEREGFRYDGYVDIFDAGPTVSAYREHIIALKKVKSYQASSGFNEDKATEHLYMVSNKNITNYKVALTKAHFTQDEKAILPNNIINDLELEMGQEVSISPLK